MCAFMTRASISHAATLAEQVSSPRRGRRANLALASWALLCLALVSEGLPSRPLLGAGEREPTSEFTRDILPILAEHCYGCHGPDADARQVDLRLDIPDGAFAQRRDGRRVLVPGRSLESELWQRVSSTDPEHRMPPADSGATLTTVQLERIRTWIDQGAHWQPHWAFQPPRAASLPPVRDPQAVRSPPDAFVVAGLEARDLRPASAADPRTLLRRLTLGLTGLPPSPQDVEAFVTDSAPDAFERVVDRLLAAPQYGERMAIDWLDAARYADTHGYLFDTERSMWRWRDWVIEAFNHNLPFDQFTIEQLAGDLLPNATRQQQIASGFHRNHIINNEAGATPEEYLVENVLDRVNTTATVWMGLTLQCCQCHDHKYDPLTQREFYELYAFFNNVPELGLDGLNSNARPVMDAPTDRDREELAQLQRQVDEAEQSMQSLDVQISRGQTEWEASTPQADEQPQLGRIGHWRFDGRVDDSDPARDQSVFEAAAASYADGVLGSALTLDGLGYLNAGDRFAFQRTDAFTLAAWVRPAKKDGRLTILSRMDDADALFRGYALQLVNGEPALFVVNRFPDNLLQVQSKQALEPNQWSHVAATYDGSGKTAGVKLFVNGELQSPGLQLDTLTEDIATRRPFWIGNGHPAAKFNGLIDEVQIFERVLSAEEIGRLPGLSIASLVAVPPDQRNAEQQRRVREHYLEHHAPMAWREAYQAVAQKRKEQDTRRRTVPTVMVMQERGETRETRVLLRGAYNKPGEPVSPGTPAVLSAWNRELPQNRLGLARWLVRPEHPLTARVIVNRIWQMHFGSGLVRTTEDFGVRGEPPSHPELLDWLAVDLVRGDWDLKALQRRIVTSATYRQSSQASPELWELDPENRLLARGARQRLPAELIRDQALAMSGLLTRRIGGPSVKPYQPDGLWREVAFDFSGGNLSAQVYQQDAGEDLFRRGLYTFWKRTSPPPTMLLFDAPDRERCVVRRDRTNTPLQALALMNDPSFVEASRKLAERILDVGGVGPAGRIEYAFLVATARLPTIEELQPLLEILGEQQARFAADPNLAEALLSVGRSPRNTSLKRHELAAYTIVAQVILTLDETITSP